MVVCLLRQANCNQLSMFIEKYAKKSNFIMMSKSSFLVLILSGVALSFLFAVFPNYTHLFMLEKKTGTTSKCQTASSEQQTKLRDTLNFYKTAVAKLQDKPKSKNPERTNEALASLNLAKEMWDNGKIEKAMKLFQHALALDSSHPDILNEYGEFLESTQEDIVLAEHLYCRALTSSPEHTRALSNRQRTLPLVEEIDQSTFNRLDNKRDILVKVPDHHPGLRRMKKENYFKHIYHTTAMEGNTFTLSQTRSFVETNMVVAGKSIMEHNEILGLDAALKYVNSTLVHRIGRITVEDILDIHKRVLGFVDPIGAGEFRKTQVFVGDHTPPAPDMVDELMDEFLDWLNSEEALNLHAIEYAALAHYKLVYIHPFYDGNGRTSRLLMNLILMQVGYPPVIIPVENKLDYYQHLETANAGDVRPFIRFIAKCTEKTLDEYLLGSVENPPVKFEGLTNILPAYDDGRTIILDGDEGNGSRSP